MEEAARLLCGYLHGELTDDEERPACVLVRFYKTHAFAALPEELREFAARMAEGTPAPQTRCLTLLATTGERTEWNDRRRSSGHQAIPLVSAEMVARAPMVAELVRAFGLELDDVVRPTSEVVPALRGRTYGIFHVPEAAGSPFIPAQREFVEAHAVRSVVGFGGTLPSGELFAIILFARVPVSAQIADRFRNLALDVKGAVLRFGARDVFAQ